MSRLLVLSFLVGHSAGPLDGVDQWAHMIGLDRSTEAPRTEMLYNFDPYILWTSKTA